MRLLFVDIETRGRVPVTVHGVYRHAADPDLRLLTVCWSLGGERVRVWRGAFADGAHADAVEPFPTDLLDLLRADDVMLVAWNAAYERIVLNGVLRHYVPDPPVIPIRRTICAAAWAAAHSLPRSLDDAGKAVLPEAERKSSAGKMGARLWSADIPMTDEDVDLYEVSQVEYCIRDVEAMMAIWRRLLDPTDAFLRAYWASETVNDTGMQFDVDLIDAAIRLAPHVDLEVRADLDRLTGGEVKPRGPSLLRWLERELSEEYRPLLTVQRKRKDGLRWYTAEGQSTDRGVRDKILAAMDDHPDVDRIRTVLDLYDEANRAAVSKYKAARDRVDADRRIRGSYILNGATTGRWSSTGIQMHNLIRKTADDPERLIHQLKTLPHAAIPAAAGMTVNRALSLSIRPGIEAPEGRMVAWCDLSAIEARTLPWLSADPEAELLLDLFRQGRDVYAAEAAKTFGITPEAVTKDQRQIGKVAVLSLGFGGAVGALTAMARNYGISLDPVTARWIVDAWRASNRWAVRYWDTLRDAAALALDRPGTAVAAGRIQYLFAATLLRGSLLAILPSGRPIVYRGARWAEVDKYGRKSTAIVYEHPTYGLSELATTIASENVTQAAAADVLREAVVWLVEAGYDVVAHTHDEIVVEADEAEIDEVAAALAEAMTYAPDWATGLPLAAEAEVGFRYKVVA